MAMSEEMIAAGITGRAMSAKQHGKQTLAHTVGHDGDHEHEEHVCGRTKRQQGLGTLRNRQLR